MTMDALTISLSPINGTGTPPLWRYEVRTPDGSIHSQMTGPRILVLESLARWVQLFEEESRPNREERRALASAHA